MSTTHNRCGSFILSGVLHNMEAAIEKNLFNWCIIDSKVPFAVIKQRFVFSPFDMSLLFNNKLKVVSSSHKPGSTSFTRWSADLDPQAMSWIYLCLVLHPDLCVNASTFKFSMHKEVHVSCRFPTKCLMSSIYTPAACNLRCIWPLFWCVTKQTNARQNINSHWKHLTGVTVKAYCLIQHYMFLCNKSHDIGLFGSSNERNVGTS